MTLATDSNQTAHAKALQAKHAAIEASIHEEQQRPRPDDMRIQSMKKEKLKIKQALGL